MLSCVLIAFLSPLAHAGEDTLPPAPPSNLHIGVDDTPPPTEPEDTDPPNDPPPAGPIDDVIAAMSPDSWARLPGTQMKDVCPTPYDSYKCWAVVGAWSGGAFDSVRDRLIVYGGGHSDSYYNNVFAFDLATTTWMRLTELPSGMTGNTIASVYQDKRVETCGLYPGVSTLDIPDSYLTSSGYVDPVWCDDPAISAQLDPQQPRSIHSYGNLAFSPATDRFYVLGAHGLYPSGQTGSSRVVGFDFDSAAWVRGADHEDTSYGASATDEKGLIWYVGTRTLSAYDPAADTWTDHADADDADGYYAGAAIDTTRNVLVATDDGLQLQTWDLSGSSATFAAVTASGVDLGQAPGFEYSPVLDRFVAWSGGRTVSFLDPATWTWTTSEGTGDDPGPQDDRGTYGRFRYVPDRDVFVVVSTTTDDVFLYRPPAP